MIDYDIAFKDWIALVLQLHISFLTFFKNGILERATHTSVKSQRYQFPYISCCENVGTVYWYKTQVNADKIVSF